MKSQFADISPVVYGVRPFLDTAGAAKTQYAFRLIGIGGGKAECVISDKSATAAAGSVLYICPGDFLSVRPSDAAFDAVEVFFDFVPYRLGLARDAGDTVGEEQFNPLLCSPKVSFGTVPAFDVSRCFTEKETAALLCSMRRYDPDGAFAPLAFRGLLEASLARLACGGAGHISAERADTAADIIAYINSHIDAALTPRSVAGAFGFHVNYVNSLVRAHTGMPLGTYIKTAKIRVADRLLSEGSLTVTQIAEKLGYFDYSHFYKAYRSITGSSPVRSSETVPDAANVLPTVSDDDLPESDR